MRLKNSLVFICLLIVFLFSCCSSKNIQSNAYSYNDIVEKYAAKYNYEINEKNSNDIECSYVLKKDNKTIELRIKKNDASDWFDISCCNKSKQLIEYEDVLELVNQISKKEYSKEFSDKVINAEDPYYNCEDYYQGDSYKDYLMCKIDYLDLTPDYCLQYIQYDDLEQIISFSGFSKIKSNTGDGSPS